MGGLANGVLESTPRWVCARASTYVCRRERRLERHHLEMPILALIVGCWSRSASSTLTGML